ncbi:MAG TPA: hypothetical protein VD962_00420 [Rubricoccaceae bacterium]|nr:hypothetical protein [Rubricoccaceae bacterium]
MAKPNYSFQKRQRDIAKKKKQEEKRQRKLNRSQGLPDEGPEGDVERGTAASGIPDTGDAADLGPSPDEKLPTD